MSAARERFASPTWGELGRGEKARVLTYLVLLALAVVFAVAAVLEAAPVARAAAHPSRDVAVTLTGPARAQQGDYVVYLATARNVGHEPVSATTVQLSRPVGWAVRGASASRGACDVARARCAIGSLASEESATVRLVLWAASPGTATVSAWTSTDPPDENETNDRAATATVVAPTRCRMRVTGGPLRAGVRATLSAAVRVGANPVALRRVVAVGPGTTRSARASVSGVARLSMRPTKAGTVTLFVPSVATCRVRVPVRES